MNERERKLYESDKEMQGILDDALALIKSLGWKALRKPDRLEVWTPGNTGRYDSFHLEITQVDAFTYHIMYWNSMNSNVRGSMRDIKGTVREQVFGVIQNHWEYDKKYVAFKQVLELLKTRRVKYYYMHDTGFEIRYKQHGLEYYLRTKLDYKSNVEAIYKAVKNIPKGKPAKERDYTSSLAHRDWRN